MDALEDALAVAAFHGTPRAAVPLLAPLNSAGDHPDRVRWLAGVCLGALGRYDAAAGWLLPVPARHASLGGNAGPFAAAATAPSAALSCRASHLRQLGRHAEAEWLDVAALAAATERDATLDALVGLVADAVGRLDLATARTRLDRAAAEVARCIDYGPDTSDSAWRHRVRLDWVRAEVALLGEDASGAVGPARAALRLSLTVVACRHTVKSQLVLGAALEACGQSRRAARVLRGAAAGADRLGLPTIVWPARTLLARVLADRAPATAGRERQRALSARRRTDSPPRGGTNR
jgi:hypothetical protein